MEIEIQLKNKQVRILFLLFLLFVSVGLAVAFYSGLSPNIFGHQSSNLDVLIAGNNINLQTAIDNGLLFSTSSSNPSITIGVIPISEGSRNVNPQGPSYKDCVGFVQNFKKGGSINFACIYDKNTGIVSGSFQSGADFAVCGYICKN